MAAKKTTKKAAAKTEPATPPVLELAQPVSPLAVYAKGIIAFLASLFGTGGAWAVTALGDGQVSGSEWAGLVVAIGTVLSVTAGVTVIPNAKPVDVVASESGVTTVGLVLFVVAVALILSVGIGLNTPWLFLLLILAVILLVV